MSWQDGAQVAYVVTWAVIAGAVVWVVRDLIKRGKL